MRIVFARSAVALIAAASLLAPANAASDNAPSASIIKGAVSAAIGSLDLNAGASEGSKRASYFFFTREVKTCEEEPADIAQPEAKPSRKQAGPEPIYFGF